MQNIIISNSLVLFTRVTLIQPKWLTMIYTFEFFTHLASSFSCEVQAHQNSFLISVFQRVTSCHVYLQSQSFSTSQFRTLLHSIHLSKTKFYFVPHDTATLFQFTKEYEGQMITYMKIQST